MILRLIQESIVQLEKKNCFRKNLIICYSPIVERYMLERYLFMKPGNTPYLFGVEVNNLWPYNEVVIYEKLRACLDDRYIIKIPIIETLQTMLGKTESPGN